MTEFEVVAEIMNLGAAHKTDGAKEKAKAKGKAVEILREYIKGLDGGKPF